MTEHDRDQIAALLTGFVRQYAQTQRDVFNEVFAKHREEQHRLIDHLLERLAEALASPPPRTAPPSSPPLKPH
jgi:hypothetical protein